MMRDSDEMDKKYEGPAPEMDDAALLDVVERAVARTEAGAAEGDTSLEGFCGWLASSAPVADIGFKDDLLVRLQSRMLENAGAVSEMPWDGEVGESVEGSVAEIGHSEWRNRVRIVHPVLQQGVTAQDRVTNIWWRGSLAVAGVAAMLALFVGLAWLLQTHQAIMDVPDNGGVPLNPVVTMGAVVTVTPVAAAAVVSKMQKLFALPGRGVSKTAWSPDGKKLAAWSGQLNVWNIETNSVAFTDEMQQGSFGMAVEWSPEGSKIAMTAGAEVNLIAGSDGAKLRTLSAPDMQAVATPVPRYGNAAYAGIEVPPSISWSPDGLYVASVYNEPVPGYLLLTPLDGNPSVTIEDHVQRSSVYVWDAASGVMVRKLALSELELYGMSRRTVGYYGQPNPIMKVAWSPNGRYIATLYSNRTIVVWDVESAQVLRTLYDVSAFWDYYGIGVDEFQWLPDGHTIAQYQRDFVELWDVETGSERSLPDIPPSQHVPAAIYTADPNLPHTPIPTYTYKDEDYRDLVAVAFSRQGDKLATIDGPYLRAWDVQAGKQTYKQDMLSNDSRALLGWAPDGKVLLYGNDQGLRFWNADTQTDLRVLSVPTGNYEDFVYRTEWSPDGSLLALVTDKGVELWGDPAAMAWYKSPTPTPLPKPVCGAWVMVNGPPVSDMAGLVAVAAIGDADVWAVGYDRGTAGTGSGPVQYQMAYSLAMHWDGQTWANVPLPHVGEGNNQLNGVAGVASDDVWAVGTGGDFEGNTVGYAGAKHVYGFVLHWDGKTWSNVAGPTPGSASNRLLAVAAVARDDVWAVGYSGGDYVKAGPTPTEGGGEDVFVPSMPLVLHWDGQSWSYVAIQARGNQRNELHALTVVGQDEVWASGTWHSEELSPDGIGMPNTGMVVQDPWLLRWDGSTWEDVNVPPAGNIVAGISVIPGGSGWLVGSLASEGGSNMTMERWDGKQWSVYPVPTQPRDPMKSPPPEESLSSVLALSSDDAWAVGHYTPVSGDAGVLGYSPDTLALHWDGWQWSYVPTPNLGEGEEYASNRLTGLARSPSGELWAVGMYSTNGSKEAPLILRFDSSGCGGEAGKP